MTLEELHRNEELRLREFPVARQKIYLAHAGVCAFPRRVQEAICKYAEGCTLADQEFVLPASWLRETRQLAADFLGVHLDEVAFVGPTSLALSFIAEGLDYGRNHNVL